MFKRDGQPFDINSQQEINGITYPRGFFNNAEIRAAFSITEEPDPPIPLSTAKARKEVILKMAYQEEVDTATITANGYTYECKDSNKLIGIVLNMLADSAFTSAPFWCYDGITWARRPHNLAELKNTWNAMRARIQQAESTIETKLSAVAAATTVAEVDAV